MFQVIQRLIDVQTLIISPPLGLGDLSFFLGRPPVHLSVCLSVTRKIMFYNPNVYLVNDNVYMNFGLNKSIGSQDIENKLNSDEKERL